MPFQQSLLFTLEHGRSGWDEDRKPFPNHYTTLGFYYLDNPAGDGPPLPALKDRIPALIFFRNHRNRGMSVMRQ